MSHSEPPKSVVVFGAGIAGLTVAHELSRLGYQVSVYEALAEPGGFFRSGRSPLDHTPTEYSWHGMGPWYHNVFDLLKQIPFDQTGSVYDKALSRPIDFGIFPEQGTPEFYDRRLRSVRPMFRFSWLDVFQWSWLMLKTWSANQRSERSYSQLNAAEQWRKRLSDLGQRTWRSCFGPWVGSDWTNASLHHVGHFFRKQLLTRPVHWHPADGDGPAWTHGPGDGWLLFRGPSSEFWFEPWIRFLRQQGVRFVWSEPLERLDHYGGRVVAGILKSGRRITADAYVLATTPFAAAEVLARTPSLERLPQLRSFKPLVADGPHVQVSFRLAFAEPIRFPRERTAVVVADSEFNLTLFATEQVWRDDVELGSGVQSLWTGTSCVSTVAGRLFGLPVSRCTKAQFIEEVKTQIVCCGALNTMVAEANDGRELGEFKLMKVEVWHEWIFSPDGIHGPQPKWVTTTRTQRHLPSQVTPVSNLFLAGAHTRTEVDIWSIEGAVESGRRAARAFDQRVQVVGQYKPWLLQVLGRIDDALFSVGGPHVLNVLSMALLFGVIAVIFW